MDSSFLDDNPFASEDEEQQDELKSVEHHSVDTSLTVGPSTHQVLPPTAAAPHTSSESVPRGVKRARQPDGVDDDAYVPYLHAHDEETDHSVEETDSLDAHAAPPSSSSSSSSLVSPAVTAHDGRAVKRERSPEEAPVEQPRPPAWRTDGREDHHHPLPASVKQELLATPEDDAEHAAPIMAEPGHPHSQLNVPGELAESHVPHVKAEPSPSTTKESEGGEERNTTTSDAESAPPTVSENHEMAQQQEGDEEQTHTTPLDHSAEEKAEALYQAEEEGLAEASGAAAAGAQPVAGEAAEDNGSDDNAPEDGEEEDDFAAMLYRAAELEVEQTQKAQRHRFALRMAEQEERLLKVCVEQQKAWVAALTAQAEAATQLQQQSLTQHRAGVQTAEELRLTVAVLQLTESEYRLKRASASVTKLRQWMAQAASVTEGSTEPTARVEAMKDTLQRLYTAAGVVPLEPSAVVESVPSTSTTAATSAEETVGQPAMLSALEKVLPLVSREETRKALKYVAMIIRKVALQSDRLMQLGRSLESSERSLQAKLRALQLPAQEWQLIAAQQQIQCAARCLSSSSTEQRTQVQNTLLRRRVQELREALAVLVRCRLDERGTKAHTQPSSSPSSSVAATGAEGVLSAATLQQWAEVEAKTQELDTLRDRLVREVVFLRAMQRETSPVAGLNELVENGTSAPTSQQTAPDSVAGQAVAMQLLEHSQRILCDLVHRVLRGTRSTDGSSGAAVQRRSQLQSLRESVASRQHSLNALLTQNAHLWQQVLAVRVVGDIAVDPERASQAAEAMLHRYGALSPEAEESDSKGPTSLHTIEQAVLTEYRNRLQSLQQSANACLAKLEDTSVREERKARAAAVFLLRLLAVSDAQCAEQLTRGGADARSAVSETPLAEVLTALESAALSPVPPSASDLALPCLPPTAAPLETRFAEHREKLQTAIQRAWASVANAYDTQSQEIDSYTAVSLAELPAQVQAAEAVRQQLQQSLMQVAARAEQYVKMQRQADTLRGRLSQLRSVSIPHVVEHLAQRQAQLRELQEANAARRAQRESEAVATATALELSVKKEREAEVEEEEREKEEEEKAAHQREVEDRVKLEPQPDEEEEGHQQQPKEDETEQMGTPPRVPPPPHPHEHSKEQRAIVQEPLPPATSHEVTPIPARPSVSSIASPAPRPYGLRTSSLSAVRPPGGSVVRSLTSVMDVSNSFADNPFASDEDEQGGNESREKKKQGSEFAMGEKKAAASQRMSRVTPVKNEDSQNATPFIAVSPPAVSPSNGNEAANALQADSLPLPVAASSAPDEKQHAEDAHDTASHPTSECGEGQADNELLDADEEARGHPASEERDASSQHHSNEEGEENEEEVHDDDDDADENNEEEQQEQEEEEKAEGQPAPVAQLPPHTPSTSAEPARHSLSSAARTSVKDPFDPFFAALAFDDEEEGE